MALHSARIDSIVTAALGNRNPIGHAQGLPPPKKITKKKGLHQPLTIRTNKF